MNIFFSFSRRPDTTKVKALCHLCQCSKSFVPELPTFEQKKEIICIKINKNLHVQHCFLDKKHPNFLILSQIYVFEKRKKREKYPRRAYSRESFLLRPSARSSLLLKKLSALMNLFFFCVHNVQTMTLSAELPASPHFVQSMLQF